MDRTKGVGYVESGGKRLFTDGPPATCIEQDYLNGVQEEVMAVIEGANITPSAIDRTQMKQAINSLIANAGPFYPPALALSMGGGGEGSYSSGGNFTLEGEHHYTTFTLNSGHVMTVGSYGYVIIRCTTAAVINGSIFGTGGAATTSIGGSGLGGGGGAGDRLGAVGQPGGSGGGMWSAGAAGLGSAVGGAGGATRTNRLRIYPFAGINGGAGGTGSAGTVAGGTGGGNMSVASEWAVCALLNQGILIGGAGAGGGAGSSGGSGGGGGGGGCVVIIVAPSITGSGTISCDGGAGANGAAAGGGGGGGGGVIILVSRNNPSEITNSAAGGANGLGGGSGSNGVAGTNGFTKKYYPGFI